MRTPRPKKKPTFIFNFKKQFAPAVESGTKWQTVRANRADGKRPAPGDIVKLYTGLRTTANRLLRQATCIRCRAVRIDSTDRLLIVDGQRLDHVEALAFALADGFTTLDAFFSFFHDTYPARPFEGFCVEWDESLPAT